MAHIYFFFFPPLPFFFFVFAPSGGCGNREARICFNASNNSIGQGKFPLTHKALHEALHCVEANGSDSGVGGRHISISFNVACRDKLLPLVESDSVSRAVAAPSRLASERRAMLENRRAMALCSGPVGEPALAKPLRAPSNTTDLRKVLDVFASANEAGVVGSCGG